MPADDQPIDLEESVNLALEGRSELRQLDFLIGEERLELARVQRAYAPSGDLSLYYEIDEQDETWSGSLDDWRANRGLALRLHLPIFDSGRTAAQLAGRRLALERLQIARRQFARQVEIEVRTAARSVAEARSRLAILGATLRVAERSYEINRRRFEAGNITGQELHQEEVRLSETRLGHLDALIETRLAWARFQRVVRG